MITMIIMIMMLIIAMTDDHYDENNDHYDYNGNDKTEYSLN